jgi:hypothetical protein
VSIQRRDLLKTVAGASVLSLAPRLTKVQEQVAHGTRAMPTPHIEDIGVIECQPTGVRLTVVKITADQDGLNGYRCATFTPCAHLVKPRSRSISSLSCWVRRPTGSKISGSPVTTTRIEKIQEYSPFN